MNWYDVLGILGAFFALFSWLQARQLKKDFDREKGRQNKKITVILRSGKQRLELPIELRRAELTRSEVLGRIGMLPMKEKGQRFSLGYLSEPEFLRRLNEIAASDGDSILEISCKNEELDQFDI